MGDLSIAGSSNCRFASSGVPVIEMIKEKKIKLFWGNGLGSSRIEKFAVSNSGSALCLGWKECKC